jgi:tetratricopeptide (TPR) repeat protein
MGWLLGMIALAAARISTWAGGRSAQPKWTPVGLASAMDQAEILMMEGSVSRAREWLSQAEPWILRMQGADGYRLRARYRALLGDLAAWTGQRDKAVEQLNQATIESDGIDDAVAADEVRTRVEAARGLMTTVEDPDSVLGESGRRALEREAKARHPEVIMRLSWLANRLAQIEHVQGRWDRARELFEHSVAIGRRLSLEPDAKPDKHRSRLDPAWDGNARMLFWSHGRKAASEAARDLGYVYASLGDRDQATRWLDQAVALVEGAEHPLARGRLAQALLDRANHEPVDPLVGTGQREALITRAVEAALACGNPEGRAIAGMAEVALAQMYASVGMAPKQLEHLRRALEHTQDMVEPSAGHNQTYLLMAIGHALDESGDRLGAIESLRQSVERGRVHPDPDTRKFAVSAAYRLHQLAWEEDRPADARTYVEVIEQLVPTLSAETRGVFAGIAAHSRGLQLVLESRIEDGRPWLERAEAMGRQGGAASGALARSAAADLGRVALRDGKPIDAEPHLRRALDTAVHQVSAADEQAGRAEITLMLADTLRHLERMQEARRECSRAFDLGRNAGNAKGREVAAIAAMWLGESADHDRAERRRYYEAASRLGRLCGRQRGREVADTVEQRLREVTG